MCVGIPGQVVRVQGPAVLPTAVVDVQGVGREVSLLYLPDVVPGDWVLTQAGFVVERLTEDDARDALAAFAELGVLPSADGPAGLRRGGDPRDA